MDESITTTTTTDDHPADPGPIYPEVSVQLSGRDGNCFAILGRCIQAASRAGVPDDEARRFAREATAGDYDHLIRTCARWFDVS